jgi:hypothetical protein
MRQLTKFILLGVLPLFSCSLLTRALGADACETEGEIVCEGAVQKTCTGGVFELVDCAVNNQICDAAGGGCIDDNLCGNGAIDAAEECDGADFGAATCDSETAGALPDGTLTCEADCTISTGNCVNNNLCGNDNIDAGEDCDNGDLGGANCDDATNGALPLGTLACDDAACQFDTSGCFAPVCGDDQIDAPEECDNNNLDGENCNTITGGAFPQGTLACDGLCQFDTTLCGLCGDGIAQANETCDDDCGGNGCNGSDNGDGCSSQCQLEVQGNCNNDNNQAGGEFCDGTDLNNLDCTSFGFASGTLNCTACNFDTTACVR